MKNKFNKSNQSSNPNLRIPGPVPIPEEILEIVGGQMINHRGPKYAKMLDRMTENLKSVFFTKNDAYFITASGTGAMESAIANTIEKNDNVLSIIIGVFGDRFAEIAESYGANVTRLEFDLGTAADLEKVKSSIKSIKNLRAVIFTHNESSTGVTNKLKDICEIIHNESDALILVDAVSSAGGIPIYVDKWGIDVVATASQKSWAAPPGISMLTVSKKAWKRSKKISTPKYYFDFQQYEDYLQMGQPPFTPALSVMYALDFSLKKIISEGMDEVFKRHSDIADYTRKKTIEFKLEILPNLDVASNTVTAIKLPENIDGVKFLSEVKNKFNVILGGGQKTLTGKIFRIGHMGWVDKKNIYEALNASNEIIKKMSL
ncbi:MAG: aminotransferase [Chloroflexi bacterium]|nr:aminotransferase [Chloroflexota bacterium]|tara:strand:+ start:1850 stop:2971 length:1122 start_codon:yes stop_codon:yes gene_type:complete